MKTQSKSFQALKENAALFVQTGSQTNSYHLKELLQDAHRAKEMRVEWNDLLLDFSRIQATLETKELLLSLAKECHVEEKIHAMHSGAILNVTEHRQVLHCALRCERNSLRFDPTVVSEVWHVIDSVFAFARRVRAGEHLGATGKRLKNVVSIGIGGSYLGPEFVHEALKFEPQAFEARKLQGELRFLANVDPVDVARALQGLDPAETLVVVVSKTFTTAETMMNAHTVRTWLLQGISSGEEASRVVAQHMIAVSADVPKANEFGIATVFGFWDWVGGRYSVCSSVGLVPLALHYGASVVESFLTGAREMDEHFFSASLSHNLPVLLALVSVWNSTFMGYSTRAILPYSQALLRFPAHIQQVSMESNGKRVDVEGQKLEGFEAGEIIFGEPGTNGQHSFYQLIHQGRVVPCDFIGVCHSQHALNGFVNHDELMSNFFAQPDALARGKTAQEVREAGDGVPEDLVQHKVFEGNRPSISLLLPSLDARRIGQLLALYENQVAVQGFMWNVNSFDQWGVELGKVLATKVRNELSSARNEKRTTVTEFYPSTNALMEKYLNNSAS